MSVVLREFNFERDYAAAARLWDETDGVSVGPSDAPEEIQKKLQRDPDLFLVAEEEGKLIGTVIGGYDGRRGLIYHLAVQAEFQRRGVGDMLLREVEDRLKAKGCYKCYLLVMKDNPRVIPFYERRGWEEMTFVRILGKTF